MIKTDKKSKKLTIRQKAEMLLKTKPQNTKSQFSEDELLKLYHELDVHQVELELQNEELMLANSNAVKLSEKYRILYDFAPSGYFTLSKEGVILELNLTASKMVDKERSFAVNRRFGGFISSETKPVFDQFFEKVINSNVSESCDVKITTKGGLSNHMHLTGIASENGEQCLLTMVDISEQKRAEEKIRQFNERLEARVNDRTAELEQSNKELKKFSYTISHDLRAPLRAIDGFTRILKNDHHASLDNEGKRLLDVVLKSTKNLGRLLDELLVFNRIGSQKLTYSLIQMEELVKDVSKELKECNQERKLKITIKALPAANGDLSLLRQAIVYLLSNAIKYTKTQNTTLIEIGFLNKDNQNTFYVKDNGVGFNMKYAHKIFDVFQRLHSPGEFEGTGMGLAIVHKIISKHGGKIWAEAEVNKGATFYFVIPNNEVERI